jgi:hypothetical protein
VAVTAPPPLQPNDGVILEARRRQVDAGVIEEARHRRHRRRLRAAAAVTLAAVIAAAVWMLTDGPLAAASRTHQPTHPAGVAPNNARRSGLDVRLDPTTTVGEAGWCEALEEDGTGQVSACGTVARASNPFLMVMGFRTGDSPTTTVVAVTLPEVASIDVNGRQRVAPTRLAGLPYGLRAARILTSSTKRPLMGGFPRLVALSAQGKRIPTGPLHAPNRQVRVLAWRSPSLPARGECRLSVKGMPDLIPWGGKVATDIRPFPGRLVGPAFLPCIETKYSFHGRGIRALMMINAHNPSEPAVALPNITPVAGSPGFFYTQDSLVATRDGSAWLMVQGSASHAQDIEVLRHLTAIIRL